MGYLQMFYGRKNELKALKQRGSIGTASFIAIKGRRRIGKSRLIREYAKEYPKHYLFTGLPPTKGITGKEQRREFITQMKRQGLPAAAENDWSDIFWVLAKACEKGSVLISLDEISWIGSKDPTFLGKLKIAWDEHFEKNSELTLVIASSISSWLDKNILNSTGFFGRISLTLTIRELPIKDCVKFWGNRAKNVSPHEKLKILGVTGGVPKYLQEIDPSKSAEDNIRRLCFSESGPLFNEFDRIFHDLFTRRSKVYRAIVELMVEKHSLSQKEICEGVGRKSGSVMSEYLNDLVTAGFINADHSWGLKSRKISKIRRYRLSDNYLRFYLKYIAPNAPNITGGRFQKISLFDATQWETIMGLQFENLVAHNSNDLLDLLGIDWSECIFAGPYFQTQTKQKSGCQIDYLIQTKTALYVCEIKFSKNPIEKEVAEEVRKKIEALKIPKHLSFRPVLVHVGGVSKRLVEEDYFDIIVDWTDLL